MLLHRDAVFDVPFSRILFFYPEESFLTDDPFIQELQENIPDIEIYAGLPKLREHNLTSNGHKLIVLDDQMEEMNASPSTLKIFTTHSHHQRLSILFRKGSLSPHSLQICLSQKMQIINTFKTSGFSVI